MAAPEEDAELKGQAHVWKMLFGYVDSMLLKLAADLHIPDIIHSNAGPMTAADIAARLHSSSGIAPPRIPFLGRIMRFLAHRGIFTVQTGSGKGGSPLYGLAPPAEWLLSRRQPNLAPFVLLMTTPSFVDPWQSLSRCIAEDTAPFEKLHGCSLWEFAERRPEFRRMFDQGMACTTEITMGAVVSCYGDAFAGIGTLVDVGGGYGAAAAELAKACPHLKIINFDLPQVIAAAPAIPGVSHVAGDMFNEIPSADAIFMKWIMHDWDDESCVRILKKCRKAIPEKTGKVVIVDAVLESNDGSISSELGVVLDMVVMTLYHGGKERTEGEWEKLLGAAGFPRYKITKIPALLWVIEAYPAL